MSTPTGEVRSRRTLFLVLQDHRPSRQNQTGMKIIHKRQFGHANPQQVISLALARHQFATPEIRLLMRQVLGHAVSGRTIKRLVRATGRRIKRGRPASTPHVHSQDFAYLIELTSRSADRFNGDTLQLFQEVSLRFGLTPRQYLKWVAKFVRRGRCMMRKCLFCAELFPSTYSGERHCKKCQPTRNHLVKEDRRSVLS